MKMWRKEGPGTQDSWGHSLLDPYILIGHDEPRSPEFGSGYYIREGMIPFSVPSFLVDYWVF
jgi:hypothetical protein